MGCADPPSKGGSVHPISVLELTNNEVVGGSCHWPPSQPSKEPQKQTSWAESGNNLPMSVGRLRRRRKNRKEIREETQKYRRGEEEQEQEDEDT